MDYADPEAENLGYITVGPMTRDGLAQAISAFELYNPNYPFPAGYITMLKGADQILAAKKPHELETEAEAQGGSISVNARSASP